MGYKLADGSDSDLYRSGDTFHYIISVGQFVAGKTVLTAHDQTFIPDEGGKITLSLNGIDSYVGEISELIPTEETRRKLADRSRTLADAYREFDCQCKRTLSKIFTAKDFPGLPVDEAEPLARIIDWLGGEKPQFGDLLVSHDYGLINLITRIDGETLWCANSGELKVGVKFDPKIFSLIRINTAAIPKQRTMTKAEAEREFDIKISD